jgi:hypothetical protein
MGWFEATVIFVTGLIAFAVLLPVGVGLMPEIQSSMGGTVAMMASTMFVVILVTAFLIYFRQSQQPDQFQAGPI